MKRKWFSFLTKDCFDLTSKEAKTAMWFFAVITILAIVLCVVVFTITKNPELVVLKNLAPFGRITSVCLVAYCVVTNIQTYIYYLNAKEND